MCFSAPVSFIASGGLAAVGAASFAAARTHFNKRLKLIAAIPLMFAIQQAFEGAQWLAARPSIASTVAGYGFLFFAFLFWPVYVPAAVYRVDEKRRRITRWLIGAGVVVSLYLFTILLTQAPRIAITNKSIDYQFIIPFRGAAIAAYMLAVCGAPMLSGNRAFRWLGFCVFVFALIAAAFFRATFISVLCFFAALISVFVYGYLRYARQ
jgi:hypothetical protein